MKNTRAMTRGALGGIILVALMLRLPAIRWGLPSTTQTLATFHPDESTNFFVMQQWEPRKFQFHPRQALWWGSLHLYLLAGTLKMASVLGVIQEAPRSFYATHLSEADRLYLVARMLSILFGVIAVWLAFAIGQRLWGRREGLLAAGLTAVAPMQVAATVYAKVDALMMFWGFVLIGLSLSILERRQTRPWRAGLAAGLAAATKYSAGIYLFLPLTALWLVKEKRWKAWIGVLAGAVIGFLIGCPHAWLDFPSFLHYLRSNWMAAEGGGFFATGYAPWSIELLRFYLPYGLGGPLLLAIVAAAAWALSQTKRLLIERWLLANLLITYLAITRPKFQLVMHALLLLPTAFLLCARALGTLWDRSRAPRHRLATVTLLTVLLGWTALYATAYMKLFWEKDARVQTSEWIQAHIPQGRSIGIAKSYFWTPPILRSYHTPYRVVGGSSPDANMHQEIAHFPQLSPDYFVLSDFETREYLRQPQLYPAQATALRDILERRYQEVARFERSPSLGPLAWPKRWIPWDWMYPYPTVTVYVRQVGKLNNE